jgi:hypothetical protein
MKAVRKQQWEALRDADEVYVIGWSMPATDENQRSFILDAMQRRTKPIDRLVAVTYRSPEEYFERLSETFRIGSDRIERFNDGFIPFVTSLPKRRGRLLPWLVLGATTVLVWALWRRR